MDTQPICPTCGKPLPASAPQGLCPECLMHGAFPTGTETGGRPARFVPPKIEELAVKFPQLEILELIGQGGMGAVYKARQKQLDRVVALKLLPPQTGGDPGFADRFAREAKALAKLNHPHIVTLYEFGQADGWFYFLMEYVDGVNLQQLLKASRLAPKEALAIVPQICEALQYAHERGIVHRDIKPDNILVSKEGFVKIADFGVAKLMGQDLPEAPAGALPPAGELTAAGSTLGTPQYMAPEQLKNSAEVDHRADIYSLGVVFYQMLTGELPAGKIEPPSKKVQIDVRLDEVVLRALEKKPELRYQAAGTIKTELETIAQTAAGGAAADPEAFIQATLARDYSLNITHCLDRAWKLVISDFWPIVGTGALVWLLFTLATSSVVGIIVGYPLLGGWWLYFLQRLRGRAVTVETAFSGFKVAFLQLVLAGLVCKVLVILGLICLLLPGIYLWVSWTFTVALVADRQLEFWPAMGLSRKMIGKHWWKFLWFLIVLALVHLAGFLLCWVGLFVASPVCLAALAYAYEDIFGPNGGAPAPAGVPAPSGPPQKSAKGLIIGIVAAVGVFLLLIVLAALLVLHLVRVHARHPQAAPVTASAEQSTARKDHAAASAKRHSTQAESASALDLPRVVSVSPADGATNVELTQDLCIRFDQPMNPHNLELGWDTGNFVPNGLPHYNASRNEFVIPVRLLPGQTNDLSFNDRDGGFCATNGRFASNYHWQFLTRPTAPPPGAVPPKVVQITPDTGAPLPVLTQFEITFDQPMTPPDQRLPYLLRKGWSMDPPSTLACIHYDPAARQFTVPLLLPPDDETKLVLEGFYSAQGVASEPVVLHCKIGTNDFSAAQRQAGEAAAQDPQLESLLTAMKTARDHLHSALETAQSIAYFAGYPEKIGFRSVSSHTARFAWQGTNQFCADITEAMGMGLKAFILGCDGTNCWLYGNDERNGSRLDRAPLTSVTELEVSLADPLDLSHRTVQSLLKQRGFTYEGRTEMAGRACHRLQCWVVRSARSSNDRAFAQRLEWWIDATTLLPARLEAFDQYGDQTICDFRFEKLNQPLDASVFQPPVPAGVPPKSDEWFDKKLDADETRFLTIRDGSAGTMSGRIGRNGPRGSTNSGMN